MNAIKLITFFMIWQLSIQVWGQTSTSELSPTSSQIAKGDLNPDRLAVEACAEDKFIQRCYPTPVEECEKAFKKSYKSCLKLKGQTEAISCTLKDLSIHWKNRLNKKYKDCISAKLRGRGT